MTDSSPRRGRPPGSRDSYPRERSYKKRPPPNVVVMLMPVIQELIDAANIQGYNKALAVAPRRDQEAVDKLVIKLLAKIKEVLDCGTTSSCSPNVLKEGKAASNSE